MTRSGSAPGDAGAYAGDITTEDCWARLSVNPKAVLVDVRTRAEWSFVGIPDTSSLGKDLAMIEWQSFPSMEINRNFIADLAGALSERSIDAGDAELMFLCRSGVRSAAAAKAATAASLGQCFNIVGGFEGPPDGDRHRGLIEGWKAAGLPWVQS